MTKTPKKQLPSIIKPVSLLVILAPIVSIVLLMNYFEELEPSENGIINQPGSAIGFFFIVVALAPIFWGMLALILRLFVARKVKNVFSFVGLCLIATGVGLIPVGIASGLLVYSLTKAFPDLETFWAVGTILVALAVVIKSGPFVAKQLFLRGKTGRFIIDNSVLFGGTQGPKRPKRKQV